MKQLAAVGIGDRVVLTKSGEKLAAMRGVAPAYGIVVEIHRTGQVRVQRPSGNSEWWPPTSWRDATEGGR
ncbi:MAG TPA: hypothetical protein DCQ64_01510 [Candidatus Rokubacteria bacterium]|nr:hypothetical protein [Candidatus Rokubacteria bacterium]